MKTVAQDWENLYASAGDASKLILVGFENEKLRKYKGKIKKRGFLQPGYDADVVIIDPETISDHATFDQFSSIYNRCH